MSKALTLSILTPDKTLFQGEVGYLSVPGGAGYMGVLVDHAPLISSLTPGHYLIRPLKGPETIEFNAVKGGLFQVEKNTASILLDSADSGALSPS